jgi:intracellular sulfur oxidation DsrE/DsrF family protein
VKFIQIVSLLAAFALAGHAHAQEPVLGVAPEPAFTEHRLTLQISDAGEAKQTTTLNVAFNILKVYGPDKVAIEIVAFGPGIDLMRDGNPNAERIRSLVAQGVHFEACNNTIETLERKTGKPFPLNPQARRVTAGVAQIMTLAEHGYTTIRP